MRANVLVTIARGRHQPLMSVTNRVGEAIQKVRTCHLTQRVVRQNRSNDNMVGLIIVLPTVYV